MKVYVKTMREMDRQLKDVFKPPFLINVDIGRPCGQYFSRQNYLFCFDNFLNNYMDEVLEIRRPFNCQTYVGVKRYGIQGSTIETGPGTVPPLTVRNKKKSDLFPMSIDEALARYGPPKGVIYTSRKKSDSLLGHQITGSIEGEEPQAANQEHHPACFPDGEDTRACHPGCRVRSGGQNAETE